MCQYNFILTEKSTSKNMLLQILEEYDFGYDEIKNEYLCTQIVGFEKAIMTTKGHCDCGSILGIDQFPSSREIDPEKERKKLRKKKWGESKINRYIEDKLKSQTRNEENRELGNKSEEDRWLKVIKKMSAENIKFGIFHHQFNSSVIEEQLKFLQETKIRSGDLKIDDLRNLEDGELLRITN